MLLVLPHEGVKLGDVESKLRTDIISDWHQNLQEGWLLNFTSTRLRINFDLNCCSFFEQKRSAYMRFLTQKIKIGGKKKLWIFKFRSNTVKIKNNKNNKTKNTLIINSVSLFQSPGAVTPQVLHVLCDWFAWPADYHESWNRGQTVGLRGRVRPTQQHQTLHHR